MAKLPKEVTYVCKPHSESYKQTGTNRVFHGVHEAYPVDSSNTDGMDRAIKWAESYGRHNTHFTEQFPNDPMTDVAIVDMETRSQNGKVYKALVHNKYYVDLRPDVVLDVMVNGLIENGVIKSPLLWVRAQGGMRLTREGSFDHINSLVDVKKVKTYTEKIEAGYSYSNGKTVVSVFNVPNSKYFELVNIHASDPYGSRRPELWQMHITYSPIYIMHDVNNIEAHDIIETLQSFNYKYGIVDSSTLDVTYSRKERLDDNKANKFIEDILEYVSKMEKFDLELNDPRTGAYNSFIYTKTYVLLLLANQLNIPIKNCANFDAVANWVNSFPIVQK